ncbi:MAG TPA: phosphatidylglycerophosphatase A [Magnetospirillaceae bacterium]
MSSSRPSLETPAGVFATWFGAGLLPRAPGTWGSLAALPFAWVISYWGGWIALLTATILVFALGVWAAGETVKQTGIQDPGSIVIDEVAGQWMTLIPVGTDPLAFLVGFILFRIADIYKPWPASWADRNIKGGLGVMLDDVMAAGYALIVMILYHRFIPGL